MPSPRATSPASASREMREIHLAKTAEQVAGAFRAAARARRGRHQRPVEVLTRAFAASSTDGRVTPEEFRAAATKLGLAVPLPDALAVFDTTEHVMRSEADGKENDDADAASNRDGGAVDARPAWSDAPTPLLLYLPWIESVLGVSSHGPRGAAAGPSAPSGVPPGAGVRPTTATAPPTRRGPLRDTDPIAKATDAFVYPHCRTSVFPPPGWDHTHVARGTALPDITLELDHVHGCGPGLVDQTSPSRSFASRRASPPSPPSAAKRWTNARACSSSNSKRRLCSSPPAWASCRRCARTGETRRTWRGRRRSATPPRDPPRNIRGILRPPRLDDATRTNPSDISAATRTTFDA